MGIVLFVLNYNVYFLASEDDKWVFLTSINHGHSLISATECPIEIKFSVLDSADQGLQHIPLGNLNH